MAGNAGFRSMGEDNIMRKFIMLAAMGFLAVIVSAGVLQAQVLFDPSVHRLERLEPLPPQGWPRLSLEDQGGDGSA